jgi:para-nitrobenzyl esterase
MMKGLFAACLLTATAAVAQERPVASTDKGRVAGVAAGAVQSFKGIPYAAPPVGPLRWRAPASAAAWSDVRDGSRFGAACPQPSDHKEAWARVGTTSEDCLFLNVWRPAKAGRYPVMVFLHGGGFTYGAAGVPLYDGAKLAARGAVVVTINYRLGLLGYFAHPALTREDPNGQLGNYGIMDAVAALKWVRTNAAAFGGDPANVTLFGESAGAGVVQLLMGSPIAAGLFHKAVSESGAGGSVLPPLAAAEALGEKLTQAAGLTNVTAAQLRSLPVDKLLLRSFPFIDGRVVVASPGTPFARKTEAKLPLMIGANSNEGTLTPNSEPTARLALGASYDAFLARYAAMPGATPAAAKVDLGEDALSILPSASIAVMHAASGGAAYSYYFTQVPASRRAGSAGSPHGGEIEYLFGNPDEGSSWDDADRAVSKEMGDRWVAFARTGKPDAAGGAAWPRVAATGPTRYLSIGTPTRADALTPLRDEVRRVSLSASAARWATER